MTANEITANLLIQIPERFKARVWRRNVGGAKLAGRYVKFSEPGESDIQGIIAPGLFLAIEVKAGKDRVSPAQESFLAMIDRHGGIAIIAHDVENTLQAIAECIEWKTNTLSLGDGGTVINTTKQDTCHARVSR